jgi:hypothetical protein
MIILGVEQQAGRPSKLSPDPGEVFVVFDGRAKATVLKTGQRLSPAELRNWATRKVVRVRAVEQSTSIKTTVAAADGVSRFAVSLAVIWRVIDFVTAAQRGDVDIEDSLRNAIDLTTGELDRQFAMTQAGADKLYEALRLKLELAVVEFVTVVRVAGRVDLDEARASQLKTFQRVQDEADIEQERLARNEEIEELRRRNAILEERTRVGAERVRHQFELEMAHERAELDVMLMQQKLELFGKLSGMGDLISLQLANDPTKVDVVIRTAREHQLMNARLQMEAVQALVNADSVEGFQLEEHAKRLLERFLQLVGGELDALPATPGSLPLPSPDGAADATEPGGDSADQPEGESEPPVRKA